MDVGGHRGLSELGCRLLAGSAEHQATFLLLVPSPSRLPLSGKPNLLSGELNSLYDACTFTGKLQGALRMGKAGAHQFRSFKLSCTNPKITTPGKEMPTVLE